MHQLPAPSPAALACHYFGPAPPFRLPAVIVDTPRQYHQLIVNPVHHLLAKWETNNLLPVLSVQRLSLAFPFFPACSSSQRRTRPTDSMATRKVFYSLAVSSPCCACQTPSNRSLSSSSIARVMFSARDGVSSFLVESRRAFCFLFASAPSRLARF
jgi:hypothetical protein